MSGAFAPSLSDPARRSSARPVRRRRPGHSQAGARAARSHRYRIGTVSAHGLAVARGHLITRLDARLEQPGGVADVQRFARHLDREFPAIWSFLFDPTIDATNWRAEQALRPAVVTRKLCGGNRSVRGAQCASTRKSCYCSRPSTSSANYLLVVEEMAGGSVQFETALPYTRGRDQRREHCFQRKDDDSRDSRCAGPIERSV